MDAAIKPDPVPPTRKLLGYSFTIWCHYHEQLVTEHKEKVDLFMLEEYAYLCGKIRDKTLELEKAGEWIMSKTGEKPHPLVSIINKWNNDKRHMEMQLGIGTHTKKRMAKLTKMTGDAPSANTIVTNYD